MNNTIEIVLQDATYTLRERLGWREQQRIDQSALHLYADGASIAAIDDIKQLREVEIRPDIEQQNYLRLKARLVGMSSKAIDEIPPAHVPLLIERIEQLERDGQAEINSLRDELNPTPPIG